MAAIDKTFDYEVPESMAREVRIGTRVRIELHGRRVGGWVVADDVEPAPGMALRPIAKVTGLGPAPEVIELAEWAAWRWAGRRASFLATASPQTAVRRVDPPAAARPAGDRGHELVADIMARHSSVVRIPPAGDRFPLIAGIAAAQGGAVLVLTPSAGSAARLATRLARAGVPAALMPAGWAAAAGGTVVVGARAAAWAPAPDLSAVIVLDAHDEAYHEERAPTWDAVEVVRERARRRPAPFVAVTPCPTLELLDAGDLITLSRADERAGWPVVDVADRRGDDPRTGLYSRRLVDLVRSGGRVICVLNRKGRIRLLACNECEALARCERCRSSVEQLDDHHLRCRMCGTERPRLCAECGATRLRSLRQGVTRAREELEVLAGVPVGEVTGAAETVADAAVLVGTEAVLHRVDRADAVAFLDFDQELLAPRYRAAEQALTLIVRAARLVGTRAGGGRVLVQTRLPDHDVLDAAVHADPGRLAAGERERRRALAFPPYAALALVSGDAAAAFVAGLTGVDVLGPDDGRYLIRAPDSGALADALAAVKRPPGRLRVEVDPPRA